MFFEYFKIKGTLSIIRYIIYPILIFIPLLIQNYSDRFAETFLILSLSLFFYIPVVLKIGSKSKINFNKEINVFLKGAGLVIIAAGFWFSTEPTCLSDDTNPGLGFYFMIDLFDNTLKLIS